MPDTVIIEDDGADDASPDRDIAVAEGAAAAHAGQADDAAARATAAADDAGSATAAADQAADQAAEAADVATEAASASQAALQAIKEAIDNQTVVLLSAISETQAAQTPPAPTESAPKPARKADKEPANRSNRSIAQRYFGR